MASSTLEEIQRVAGSSGRVVCLLCPRARLARIVEWTGKGQQGEDSPNDVGLVENQAMTRTSPPQRGHDSRSMRSIGRTADWHRRRRPRRGAAHGTVLQKGHSHAATQKVQRSAAAHHAGANHDTIKGGFAGPGLHAHYS